MAPSGREHDRQLRIAVEELIVENGWSAGQVISAVAQAKQSARDLYAACGLDLPAPEDYVALILASARHRLTHR
jgi:hypothetical protein